MEIYGRCKDGEVFPLEAGFSGWPARDDFRCGPKPADAQGSEGMHFRPESSNSGTEIGPSELKGLRASTEISSMSALGHKQTFAVHKSVALVYVR